MTASITRLVVLLAVMAASSAAFSYDEAPVDARMAPAAAPRTLPQFGSCSSDLATVNVTEYTRMGMKLTELRAYESANSGCIEALVQALELPATGKRVLLRSGQPGSLGLTHAGTIRLDPSSRITAVSVYNGNARSSSIGCITKIDLQTEGPEGQNDLTVRSRAFEVDLARPPVTWRTAHYVAGLHMKSLRDRCAASSGYPLMQLLPSMAVPSAST